MARKGELKDGRPVHVGSANNGPGSGPLFSLGITKNESSQWQQKYRAGQILTEMSKNGQLDKGGRPELTGNTMLPVYQRLADLGVTRKESSRWQFAECLANELDVDMTDSFVRASDRVLIRLWIEGYKLAPITPEEDDDG